MIVYKASSPFNSTCIKPGETLDFINFQLEFKSLIDQGANKKCWKAKYSSSGQSCLKAVLVHASVRNKEDVARIINEIQIHRLLEGHPAILNVDQSLFIRANEAIYWIQVMPLFCCNLYNAIKCKFFFDIRLVLDVLDQLANGMAYIHSQGIVLGDVKSKNILFEEGRIKYIDFGGAGFKNNYENTQTWDYRAPECFEVPLNSFRTNIWSLGLIFALIINNRGKDTPYDMCIEKGVRVNSYSYKSAVSDFTKQIKPIDGITEIVNSMMNINPFKRPSADTFISDLRFPKAMLPTKKFKNL